MPAESLVWEQRSGEHESIMRDTLGVDMLVSAVRTSLVLMVLCVVGIAGCATKGPPEDASTAKTMSPPDNEYRIGVDDRIQISVWKNPDLSITVPVRPDGMVSMPLVGDVTAGGQTTSEVAETIRKKLTAYIRDPSVAVIVTELHSGEFISRVRITGAVRTQKSLPFRQGMTVLDAVLEAGGPTEFASPNRSKLYRRKKGSSEVLDIELGDILSKGRLETNYTLKPGDVITVPERLF